MLCSRTLLVTYFNYYSAVSMDQNVLHTVASRPLHGAELKSSSVILGAALSFPGSWKGRDLPEKNELMEDVERGTFCGLPTDLKAVRSLPCLQFEVALCSQSRELLLMD